MTSAELLPAAVLNRKAVVYIRRSTQTQVQTNLESQRRQYELVDIARQRGFRDIEVIDDDLGRSARGFTARPSFERLVAGYAPVRLAPCCALTHSASLAMAAIGITCSSYVAWSGPG
jgi:hypothetical protein